MMTTDIQSGSNQEYSLLDTAHFGPEMSKKKCHLIAEIQRWIYVCCLAENEAKFDGINYDYFSFRANDSWEN